MRAMTAMADATPTPQPEHQSLRWDCLPFDALDVHTLYALLQLRSAVFVVEQRCAFLELDGADAPCHHLLARTPSGDLWACARLVPPGLKYPEASIGRVVTAPAARGLKLGHELMARACAELARLWGEQPIRIGAQARLQGFYQGHGFVTVSEPYDEDGIAHVEMLYQPGDKA